MLRAKGLGAGGDFGAEFVGGSELLRRADFGRGLPFVERG